MHLSDNLVYFDRFGCELLARKGLSATGRPIELQAPGGFLVHFEAHPHVAQIPPPRPRPYRTGGSRRQTLATDMR